MTVKCLNELQKEVLVNSFQHHHQCIDSLAIFYDCSRRTVIRVLEEKGIDPGIKRRASKPRKPVPGPVVTPTKLPWYRRILERVMPSFQ
jgi:hypothetical protein